MRTEIDARPAKGSDGPYFAIRLFPDTNEEMAQLEWAKSIDYVPKPDFLRNQVGNSIHYAIIFKKEVT